MVDGRIFLKTSPLSLMTTYRMSLISAGSISLDSTFNVSCDRYGRGGPPQPPSPVHQNVADLASLMELKVGTRCSSTLSFHVWAKNCATCLGPMQEKGSKEHGLACYVFDIVSGFWFTTPFSAAFHITKDGYRICLISCLLIKYFFLNR